MIQNTDKTNITHNNSHDIPRICFVTDSFYPVPGGAENHSKLLAGNLISLGMDSIVITRHYDPLSPSIETIDGIKVYRVPPINPGRWMKYLSAPYIYNELCARRNEYDLIYVCGFKLLGISAIKAARRFGKKCIFKAETNGEMSGEYATAYRSMKGIERFIYQKWLDIRNPLLCQADGYICMSELIANELIMHGIFTEKLHMIPNGIDASLYQPLNMQSRLSLREKLRLPADKTILAFSGRFIPGKGVINLVEAWKVLSERYPNACLLMIGSGKGEPESCEEEIRDFIRTNNLESRIIFTGWVDKVYEYLQAADIFVFPTEFEGFGLSIVEAMLCGLPVVASGVGAIPEILDQGKNGIMIEPRNTESLIHGISILLNNPDEAKIIGTEAFNTAISRYTIQAVAKKHYDLFTSIHSNIAPSGRN